MTPIGPPLRLPDEIDTHLKRQCGSDCAYHPWYTRAWRRYNTGIVIALIYTAYIVLGFSIWTVIGLVRRLF